MLRSVAGWTRRSGDLRAFMSRIPTSPVMVFHQRRSAPRVEVPGRRSASKWDGCDARSLNFSEPFISHLLKPRRRLPPLEIPLANECDGIASPKAVAAAAEHVAGTAPVPVATATAAPPRRGDNGGACSKGRCRLHVSRLKAPCEGRCQTSFQRNAPTIIRSDHR
jgi:hypothetical protein